ncbi:MAG: hypothetical protein WKF97_19255 [Chitinophagaceae bacterium]
MEKQHDRWLRFFLPLVLILIALYNGKTLIPYKVTFKSFTAGVLITPARGKTFVEM